MLVFIVSCRSNKSIITKNVDIEIYTYENEGGIQASGQHLDYKTFRDSLTQLSCGQVDSLTVVNTRTKLETVDTNLISSNIDIYYRDLGWCYYRLYLKTKDISFIRMASDSYEKALSHNPKYAAVLHDQFFFNYFFFKDCQKGKYYMALYKKVTPRKYWNKDEMKRLSNNCDKFIIKSKL